MMLLTFLTIQKTYYDLSQKYFENDHTYQIRLLYKPLLCDKIGRLTQAIELYHAGLGFVDIETGAELMINLNLIHDNPNPNNWSFPEITKRNDSELYDIKWFNYVGIVLEDEILTGRCNWQNQIIIGETRGELLNEYINSYATDFNEKYTTTYMPIELRWRDNGSYYNQLRSKQCQDFAFGSVQYMQTQLGLNITDKFTVRNHAFVNIETADGDSAVRKLDINNKHDNKIIVNFYKMMHTILSNKSQEEKIQLFMTGEVYQLMGYQFDIYRWVHIIENDYYLVKSRKFPWVGFTNEKESLLYSD